MLKKLAVPTQFHQALLDVIRLAPIHLGCTIIPNRIFHRRRHPQSLNQPRIVAMECTPNRLVIDPMSRRSHTCGRVFGGGSIGKIPHVDGIWPPNQTTLGIPTHWITHGICQGPLYCRQHLAHPGIITRHLPGLIHPLHKQKLHICFDILAPRLNPQRRHVEPIRQTTIGTLGITEGFKQAFDIRLYIAEPPPLVDVITQPQQRVIRRTIALHTVPIQVITTHTFL